MGQDPGEIREEIEQTRAKMSETADALASKADVRGRVKEKATASKEVVVAKAREVRSNPQQLLEQSREAARRAAERVRRNPKMAALPAAPAVVLIAAALWRTRRRERGRSDQNGTDIRSRGAAQRVIRDRFARSQPRGYNVDVKWYEGRRPRLITGVPARAGRR